MIRPVILSRPEKLAFLLMIFCAGGSVTISSPGCSVGGACGTPLGWRCPGGNPGSGLPPDGAVATPCPPPWPGPCPGCGGTTATPGGAFCGTTVVPGGAANGCD